MPSAFLHNFKALLPSWKFFDRVGSIPTFAFRADSDDWIFWAPQAPRGLSTLFLNGEGNLELAKVSLLERVLEELSEDVKPEAYLDSVSYQLLLAWAREEVKTRRPLARRFQFKVGHRSQLDPRGLPEDGLISLEHEI